MNEKQSKNSENLKKYMERIGKPRFTHMCSYVVFLF